MKQIKVKCLTCGWVGDAKSTQNTSERDMKYGSDMGNSCPECGSDGFEPK